MISKLIKIIIVTIILIVGFITTVLHYAKRFGFKNLMKSRSIKVSIIIYLFLGLIAVILILLIN